MNEERDRFLRRLQEVLWRRFSRPIGNPLASLGLLFDVGDAILPYVTSHYDFSGFVVPGRRARNLCFAYNGIAFAAWDAPFTDPAAPLEPSRPSLLMFDDGGRLHGCGYVRRVGSHPRHFAQALRGISPDEWFVHPAGYHTVTGRFVPHERTLPRPPLLRVLAEAADNFVGARVGFAGGSPGLWHDAYWDLHIHFDLDEQGRSRGPAIVAETTRASDVRSPPNPPHDTIRHLLDRPLCARGVDTHGMYEPITTAS